MTFGTCIIDETDLDPDVVVTDPTPPPPEPPRTDFPPMFEDFFSRSQYDGYLGIADTGQQYQNLSVDNAVLVADYTSRFADGAHGVVDASALPYLSSTYRWIWASLNRDFTPVMPDTIRMRVRFPSWGALSQWHMGVGVNPLGPLSGAGFPNGPYTTMGMRIIAGVMTVYAPMMGTGTETYGYGAVEGAEGPPILINAATWYWVEVKMTTTRGELRIWADGSARPVDAYWDESSVPMAWTPTWWWLDAWGGWRVEIDYLTIY